MTNDLREKAEAATPGPWEATDGVVWIDTREQVCCGRGYQECCGEPDVIGGQEKVADTNAPNAAYIAAANPAAIIALLDELDALRAKVKSQTEALNGLVRRLDEIHADPTYQSVWTLNHLHNGPYKGPQYADELAAARRAAQEASDE